MHPHTTVEQANLVTVTADEPSAAFKLAAFYLDTHRASLLGVDYDLEDGPDEDGFSPPRPHVLRLTVVLDAPAEPEPESTAGRQVSPEDGRAAEELDGLGVAEPRL